MKITIEQIEEALDYFEYDYYGLPVIEIEGDEYAVGKPSEVHDAIIKYCKENIQYFKPEFLAQNSKYSDHLFATLQKNDVYDSDVYLELIDDIESFAEEAEEVDGRGHFLSPYDGEEIGVCDDEGVIFYYLYRIN